MEDFITVDEYLSKHYSSAISLLLRLPNLKMNSWIVNIIVTIKDFTFIEKMDI